MEREKYNCLVVDDEPIARRIIVNYIEQMPLLTLAAECINSLSTIDYLRTHTDVDIIFLDINMPHLSGLQLLKIVQPQQPVIFTTAYSEYAVESYDLNAVDYLVKPIEFDRFIKAVNKARELFQLKGKKQDHAGTAEGITDNGFVLLKSGALTHKVNISDILFIEKEENYLAFQTTDKKILVRANMTEVFEYIPESQFCRVHKSFVAALKHIHTIEVHQVSVGKYKIPVGSSYREELMQKIK